MRHTEYAICRSFFPALRNPKAFSVLRGLVLEKEGRIYSLGFPKLIDETYLRAY
jgi:hypothetical protein